MTKKNRYTFYTTVSALLSTFRINSCSCKEGSFIRTKPEVKSVKKYITKNLKFRYLPSSTAGKIGTNREDLVTTSPENTKEARGPSSCIINEQSQHINKWINQVNDLNRPSVLSPF